LKLSGNSHLPRNIHGKNLLNLLQVLSETGPVNRYELAKAAKVSYPLVHKSIKELAKFGFLYKYGSRSASNLNDNHKHDTSLWGLSLPGLWELFLSGKISKNIWIKIKQNYHQFMGGYLDEVELISRIDQIKEKYGYIQEFNYPGPDMIACALIFASVSSESKLPLWYTDVAKVLSEYPDSTKHNIINQIEIQKKALANFLQRCELLTYTISNTTS
jgi:hypothetical protein